MLVVMKAFGRAVVNYMLAIRQRLHIFMRMETMKISQKFLQLVFGLNQQINLVQ